MEMFTDLIWWVLTIIILPLDGGIIINNIYEGNFNSSFWFFLSLFILYFVSALAYVCIFLKRERKTNDLS